MANWKYIGLVFCILVGIDLTAGAQISLFIQTEETNLGKKLEIPVLSAAIREGLIKEGYKIAESDGDQSVLLYIKVFTREGSESQGIFTSYSDMNISLKYKDNKVVGEKSIIGSKGAGLNFQAAGISAIKKSTEDVLSEILQILNEKKEEIISHTVQSAQLPEKATEADTKQTNKTITVSQPARGSTDELNKPVTDPNKITGPGIYYALIIGINDYKDANINNLDNPIKDATRLFETLTTHYTFNNENVYFLKNPTREQIIIALDDLSKKIKPTDNFLFFYAGHGHWDEKKHLGYWLPSDATKANTANWLMNSTIQDYISSIASKHTLLIADACFSGSIFKTRKAFNDAPPSIEKLYELPSRKGMTSGTMTVVPDQSVFLEFLNKRLTENNQIYLSSEQLFTSFREAVMNNSPNTPQYGTIQNAGDEGGDFIFIKK